MSCDAPCQQCVAWYHFNQDADGTPVPGGLWVQVAGSAFGADRPLVGMAHEEGFVFFDSGGLIGPPGGLYWNYLDPQAITAVLAANNDDIHTTLEEYIALAFSLGFRQYSPGFTAPNTLYGDADDYAITCGDQPPQPLAGCPTGYYYNPTAEACAPICGLNPANCLPVLPILPNGGGGGGGNGGNGGKQCGQQVLDCDGVSPFTEYPTPCNGSDFIDKQTGCCRPCCCAVNRVNV